MLTRIVHGLSTDVKHVRMVTWLCVLAPDRMSSSPEALAKGGNNMSADRMAANIALVALPVMIAEAQRHARGFMSTRFVWL